MRGERKKKAYPKTITASIPIIAVFPFIAFFIVLTSDKSIPPFRKVFVFSLVLKNYPQYIKCDAQYTYKFYKSSESNSVWLFSGFGKKIVFKRK